MCQLTIDFQFIREFGRRLRRNEKTWVQTFSDGWQEYASSIFEFGATLIKDTKTCKVTQQPSRGNGRFYYRHNSFSQVFLAYSTISVN